MHDASDRVENQRHWIVRGLYAAACVAACMACATAVADEMSAAMQGAAWAALAAGLLAAGLARRELAHARHASAATRDMLATAAHECRTPLHALLALVELARRDASTEAQRQRLAFAYESGESLARLLDDLLDHARADAGRLPIRPAAVEPRALFDGVFALLAPQARDKGLRLRLRVRADVPAVLCVDGDRVRQILVNLLGNAIKFTESGTVSLDARAAAAGGTIELTVEIADTGRGIDGDVRAHVFEPYATGSRAGRRPHAGAGLGLAISRRIATSLGGDLLLASEAGGGTVATLRLHCPVVAAHRPPASLAGLAMAIEHDEPAVAAALRDHARAAGMRIVAPDTAERTVRLSAAAHGQAIVWLDAGALADPQARVLLDCDPLTWRGFVDACETALAQHAGTNAATNDGTPAGGHREPAGRYRVLIVDDHALQREALQRQLEQLGHRVSACRNGRDALDVLETGTADVDVVLTDLLMPVMDGIALTTALRAHARPRLRALPVVVLTGLAGSDVGDGARSGAEAGATAYLRKPVALDVLGRTLDAVTAAARDRAGGAGEPVVAARRFDAAALDEDALLQAFGVSTNPDGAALDILALCRRSLSDDRAALARALDDGDRAALRRWCHTVSGAFGLFRQVHVDMLVDALRTSAATGEPGAIRAEGEEVLRLMDYLIGHVMRLAASVPAAPGKDNAKGGDG